MFLFMALPSGCRRAVRELRLSAWIRRIRAERPARCDTFPKSGSDPRESYERRFKQAVIIVQQPAVRLPWRACHGFCGHAR